MTAEDRAAHVEREAVAGVLLSDEPTYLAARVIDRDGDVWAMHAGRWGCLTMASATQTWSDLWHVCGPLTVLAALPQTGDAAAQVRTLARRCHNGAPDPWQEFYDLGLSPLLDKIADALAAESALTAGDESPGAGHV